MPRTVDPAHDANFTLGHAALTPREQQVVDLLTRGATNKEIGEQLQIAERTVKAHLTTIFRKLHVASRLQLAVSALRGL